MSKLRLCKFYGDPASPKAGDEMGYCELDCVETVCAGDIDSCPKSNSLKRYFFEQIRKNGGFEWERRIDILFSEDPKARA